MNALLNMSRAVRVWFVICLGCCLVCGLTSLPSQLTLADEETPFKKPEGALSDDSSDEEEKPKIAAPKRPTDLLILKAYSQAAKDSGDAKLSAAIERLEKEEQAGKARFFKAYKAKLAKIKSTMASKKQLSPILEGEFERLLASCDQNQFPQLRIQGTLAFEKHDYAYLDGDYTWHVAKEVCEALGGHLVTLNSPAEIDFVVTKFLRPNRRMAWLGGTDEKEEGVWQWITGEPWNFAAGINNDYGVAHELTWWQDIGFHDWIGGKREALVCEWETTASRELISLASEPNLLQTQSKSYLEARIEQQTVRQKLYREVHSTAERLSKSGILSDRLGFYAKFGFEAPPERRENFKKSSYALFREPKTWHEAQIHCENLGGHLVYIDAPGEAEFIVKLATENRVTTFIGCSDEWREGLWLWRDGTSVKLRMQLDNANGDNHVGAILVENNTPPVFLDHYSGFRGAYICEWD